MGIRNISEVTKREIFSLFCDGYTVSSWIEGDKKIFYHYFGCLTEIEFLKKLYPISEIPSTDSRFSDAEGDIRQHTINNDDWEYGWIFSDSRFELQDGDDNILLRFLCAVFHPIYRKEEGYWKEYLNKIQLLLRTDGYELYISAYLSGRAIYSWRILTDAERASSKFLPFSVRYNRCTIQCPTISRSKRNELINMMHRREENEYLCHEGWNYNRLTCEAVMDDIKEHYTPKAYNSENKYCVEDNFDNFLMGTSPKNVFDIIEFYARYKDISFANEVNLILNGLNYKLLDGKMMPVQYKITAELPKEGDLRELLQIAEGYYAKNDSISKQSALEKVWDAFEKLKTYYSTDKRSSVETILDRISDGDSVLKEKLNGEFKELTNIGNNYQIRHFETGKLPINDIRIKEYLYTRCLSLINLSIGFIEEKC